MEKDSFRHCSLRLLFVLVFWVAADGVTVTASEEKPSHAQAVIAWLKSQEGAFFSDKIFFENGGMSNIEDFSKDELIVNIPPRAFIGQVEEALLDDKDEEECLTAERLAYEYVELGEAKNQHWPYLQYVFDSFPHETVPMGWSEEGKCLIQVMVGDQLHPQNFGSGPFVDYCGYNETKYSPKVTLEVLEAAWRIVMCRGWDHIMVPVFDMFNHRNGKWLNVERDSSNGASLQVDGDCRIVANNDIPKGSQLYNSYSQCNDVTCPGIEHTYLTPQIFADYGFVEQYPHRFAFHTGYEEGAEDETLVLLVEVDLVDNDPDKLELAFLRGKPNSEQIAWLEKQWERLDTVDIVAHTKELNNEHEEGMVLAFYQAFLTTLNLSIQAGSSNQTEL